MSRLAAAQRWVQKGWAGRVGPRSPQLPSGALRRGQGQLAGQVRQRLKRRPRPLVNLGAGLRGQPSAFLDQGKRGVDLEIGGAKLLGRLLEPDAQLGQGIVHAEKGSGNG
jgi:hypothetical protein